MIVLTIMLAKEKDPGFKNSGGSYYRVMTF